MARWNLSIEDRFWSKVDNIGGVGCWLWTAGKRTTGYGAFYYKNRVDTAHRVAWELSNKQSIPDGLHALHTCDVRLCVRPSHVFIGTNTDNIADKVSKGRQSHGNGLIGERHPRSKLSDSKVRDIRASSESCAKAAKTFGVCRALISHVRTGRLWRHIPMVTADDSLTVVRG